MVLTGILGEAAYRVRLSTQQIEKKSRNMNQNSYHHMEINTIIKVALYNERVTSTIPLSISYPTPTTMNYSGGRFE